MKKNDTIPDFDDLIFESRNREYGAYQLRKKYNNVLLAGVIIATFIGCSAVLIPFMINPEEEVLAGGRGRMVEVQIDLLEAPQEQIYVPPAPPPPQKAGIQEVVKYVPPVVVDTIVPIAETQISTDYILEHAGESNIEIEGGGGGDDLLSGTGDGGLDEPFFLVEVMPSFRGGNIDRFREWVNKRTNYPQAAIDGKIRGTVFLTFIVEKDGSVSNVTVLKGVHPLLDNEAIKAIAESPRWSPGLQRGQPVRVRFQIPLSFVL